MSHRKVLSQGNVPFSWEEKPGISKALCFHSDGDSQLDDFVSKIPPPPCRPRNASAKGIRWEEDDPFLVAYKECTKSVKNNAKFQRPSKGALVNKSKLFSFSCKSFDSCQVRDDAFFKLRRTR